MQHHDSNCHFNAILDLQRKRGHEREFLHALGWYLAYGYVIATPEFFAVYRPVIRTAGNIIPAFEAVDLAEADAWYFECVAGDPQACLESVPAVLPFAGGWRSRWKESENGLVKWVPFHRLKQLLAMNTNLIPEMCF